MKVTSFNCGPFANASERKALEHLKHRLISVPGDGEWVLLTNLAFSASHRMQAAEIDIVAIGPPGVRVIEVKHWSTRWVNRNQDLVEHEADKVTDKARKIGTTLRGRVHSGLGHVDGIFLVTQARSKVQGLANRQVNGVSVYSLDQWRDVLDADAPEILSGLQVQKLAEALAPKASVALDGSLRRLAGYVDLSLQTPDAERFHRTYRATHASRRERVILHLYDLSAVDDGAETKAQREYEALRRVQSHKWAPRIRDSYQAAPGYDGEMAFFTIDDPAAPSLASRASDTSWGTEERLDFALQALRALVELHAETSGGEPLVHRSLSPETVLVRHDNLPILTGFDRAKMAEHATVAAISGSAKSTAASVAPEVRKLGLAGADHRSDVYQLCATLARLFSGRTDESSRDALKLLGDGTAEVPRDRADLRTIIRAFRELRGEQLSRPAPPPAEFWTAEQVVRFGDNDYQIVEKLGQGGIGIAYKVAKLDPRTEEALGHYVAKVVLNAPTGRVVLESYSRVHAHLRHSALSTIFEVARDWQENSILALLTWIEGEPLKDYLGVLSLVAEERLDGAPESAVLNWLRELCKALAVLHRNELVHGDVSPGNLILTDSEIVLTDYDLVTRIGQVASSPGTYLYCSPSRAEQHPVAASDDFYALAASFFHALFGNKPFQYGGDWSKDRGLNWEGIDSAEFPVIRHFLDRATDPRTEGRYSSAADALADLSVHADRDPQSPEKPSTAHPQPPPSPAVPVQPPRSPTDKDLDDASHFCSGKRDIAGLDPAETSVGVTTGAGQSRDVKDIVRRLEAIRQRLGLPKVEFVPRGFESVEDKNLNTPQEVEDLFHPSGLLIHLRSPVFIYIRDHTMVTYSDVSSRRRIHFSVCSTLRAMKTRGRYERYRRTTRVDDVYLIDVYAHGEQPEKEMSLYPCKHCLMEVNYLCYQTAYERNDKQRIVEEFKAREALDFLRQQFDLFDSQTKNVQSANLPTGYSASWSQSSVKFRTLRNFTCEECGVQLRQSRSLLDVHHLSGDKRDNRDKNLRCLCKLCHAEMHTHYNVSDHHRTRILELRRSQGLSNQNL